MEENNKSKVDPDSPFPEYETKSNMELPKEASSIHKCEFREAHCLIEIIFRSGTMLKFEHWATPTEFLRIWGHPHRGNITVDIDAEHYITINKKEVASKSVQIIF